MSIALKDKHATHIHTKADEKTPLDSSEENSLVNNTTFYHRQNEVDIEIMSSLGRTVDQQSCNEFAVKFW